MEEIKKVIVIHKTHLDIGFTDFAQNVMDNYVMHFIPKAIETAAKINLEDSPKKFVWTVGSYLVQYYMEHADKEGIESLKKAISMGNVEWHCLPCTTHTELMSAEIFKYGLEIGKNLDCMFGKHHFAAKMTDVPGHTIAMVPYLVQYGVKYLHIGINAASRPVDVPELCIVKYGEDEIILNYAKDYGEACVFKNIALEFAHTADNVGPPDEKAVHYEMKRLKQKYPNAEILSGSLEDFAQEVLPYKDELPVIIGEMGDTWIHGISTDPFKTAMIREMNRIAERWKLEQPQGVYTKEYRKFMEYLLLLCEHTWGLDEKTYLCDHENWDKKEFLPFSAQARAKKMEASWQEQREYLQYAKSMLPEHLKRELLFTERYLQPSQEVLCDRKVKERKFNVNGWSVCVEDDGSLKILCGNGCKYSNTLLGIFRYQIFSAKTVEQCYWNYNRNQKSEGEWAEPDFAKPGLGNAETAKDELYSYQVEKVYINGNRIIIEIVTPLEAMTFYGSPRCAQIIYTFEREQIYISLKWFGKEKNRMPEAIFFGYQFDSYQKMKICKLGKMIDPLKIVDGGNKKLHAVEKVQGEKFEIYPFHSPLLSVGGMHLYDTEDEFGDLNNGLFFLLYNNRWNTNFPLWYSQNAAFEFKVRI